MVQKYHIKYIYSWLEIYSIWSSPRYKESHQRHHFWLETFNIFNGTMLHKYHTKTFTLQLETFSILNITMWQKYHTKDIYTSLETFSIWTA